MVNNKIVNIFLGSYQSGQLGLTVTQLSFDFGGSNPSLPTTSPNPSKGGEKRNFKSGGEVRQCSLLLLWRRLGGGVLRK